MRIPETWESRGYEYPKDGPSRSSSSPRTTRSTTPPSVRWSSACRGGRRQDGRPVQGPGRPQALHHPRPARAAGRRRPTAGLHPRTSSTTFKTSTRIPSFEAATFEEGQTVRGVIGLDGGSTSSKAVLVDYETGEILYKAYTLSKGNPIQDTKDILAEIQGYMDEQGATFECMGFGATGYAANVLEESVKADVNIVETVAHMMSAIRYVPDADVVCDIGGQDIKVLFLAENKQGSRDVRDFKLSNQCSAGNGMLLQAMADQFGVHLYDYADTAFSAGMSPKFSYGCAVFLDADRVNFQKEGFSAPEMLAGLAQVLPKNVWQYVVQVPRLAEYGEVFVLQGGTQRNLAAVKAQVDYIERSACPTPKVVVHPPLGEAGAIGAAMETLRVVKRRGHSTFIGMQSGHCARVHHRTTSRPSATSAPTSAAAPSSTRQHPGRHEPLHLRVLLREGDRREQGGPQGPQPRANIIRKQYPNLVEYEAKLAFKHFYEPAPIAPARAALDDVEVKRRSFKRVARRAQARLPANGRRPGPQQHQDRHSAGAQRLHRGALLPDLLRDPGHQAEHRLQHADLRGDVGGGRAATAPSTPASRQRSSRLTSTSWSSISTRTRRSARVRWTTSTTRA